MLTRCSYAVTWQYITDLPIGADVYIPIGCDLSGWSVAHPPALPYFSIDVYTDDEVEVELQTGTEPTTITAMVTLICAPVLQHNTIYNLAPPFNRDGFIVVTGNHFRIRVVNPTGNIVSPFHLSARLWK